MIFFLFFLFKVAFSNTWYDFLRDLQYFLLMVAFYCKGTNWSGNNFHFISSNLIWHENYFYYSKAYKNNEPPFFVFECIIKFQKTLNFLHWKAIERLLNFFLWRPGFQVSLKVHKVIAQKNYNLRFSAKQENTDRDFDLMVQVCPRFFHVLRANIAFPKSVFKYQLLPSTFFSTFSVFRGWMNGWNVGRTT